MSKSNVYFDTKGEEFNLKYLKKSGRNGYPVFYVYAVYAQKGYNLDDVMGVCEFVVHKSTRDENKKVCFLKTLEVERAYLEHGIGSYLLKAMENVALENGANDVTVKLPNDSATLSNFYVKNGYGVSGYLAFKNDIKLNNDIVAEPIKEVTALSDDALSTL